MNRARPASLSGGAMLRLVALDGSCCVNQDPSLTAQLLVTHMGRKTYSCTVLHTLFGSTKGSAPSPPKLEPITRSPERLRDCPLSCRPPGTPMPQPLSRPALTE